MGNATKEQLVQLETIMNEVTLGLPKTKTKRMFGCHGLFANDSVFGLVWKEGRIGVRLPEGAHFQKLMSQKGAKPWKAGKMTMSHWVLVPEAMHSKKRELSQWLGIAHELALATPKSTSVKTKKAKPKKKLN